jgi:ABC-type uncharacterized transport system permease subunit
MAGALLAFGVFVWFAGHDPMEVWTLLFKGAFGDCLLVAEHAAARGAADAHGAGVALPARAGLTVIGGEGALVLGGLAARRCPWCCRCRNLAAARGAAGGRGLMGALWIALAGALRQYRGVNETISSLLLGYLAIALFKHIVEGPLRDPASLNKPHPPAGRGLRIGSIGLGRALGPGLRVSWPAWRWPPVAALDARALRCAWWAATRAPRGWWACRRTG